MINFFILFSVEVWLFSSATFFFIVNNVFPPLVIFFYSLLVFVFNQRIFR